MTDHKKKEKRKMVIRTNLGVEIKKVNMVYSLMKITKLSREKPCWTHIKIGIGNTIKLDSLLFQDHQETKKKRKKTL